MFESSLDKLATEIKVITKERIQRGSAHFPIQREINPEKILFGGEVDTTSGLLFSIRVRMAGKKV